LRAFLQVSGFRFQGRLSETGDALDPNGIVIGAGDDAKVYRVIWDGHRFLVAWSREGLLYLSTLDHHLGQIVAAPDGLDLIARPDGGTLMLSVDGGALTLRAIDDDLRVTNRFALDRSATNCRLVRSGNAMVAIWTQLDATNNSATIIAQRVAENGAVGFPAQIATLNDANVTLATSEALVAYGAAGTVHVFDVQPAGALTPRKTYAAKNVASITRTNDGGFVATEQAQPPAPTTFHELTPRATHASNGASKASTFPRSRCPARTRSPFRWRARRISCRSPAMASAGSSRIRTAR